MFKAINNFAGNFGVVYTGYYGRENEQVKVAIKAMKGKF